MFNQKKENLFTKKPKKEFLEAAKKATRVTTSDNGAKKYSTSGSDFVDQFSKVATFLKPRTYKEVSRDMYLLWSQNPIMCLKLAVYIRMITRKTDVINGETTGETQKGQGLRNEGILRMLWIAVNQPKTFKANVYYFISAGSWKDIIQMLSLDLQYHGWSGRVLDWLFISNVLRAGLMNDKTTHLVRKYLPTIRTNAKCTTVESQADTLIGRWFAKRLFPGIEKEAAYTNYRKLKSQGVAHQWQQQISQQLYSELNFGRIAGRALALLVGSKFLKNHNLEQRYSEWISQQQKEGVKYTGFVFEIFNDLDMDTPQYQKDTINAQFTTLTKEKFPSSLLVVRDISRSMDSTAAGTSMSAGDIAKAMALYFSESLTGDFANSYMVFAANCELREWKGKTPCDKWINDTEEYYGNTDFQGAIDLLIKLREMGVEESTFPEGLLVVSDGEMDYCSDESNFEEAYKKMSRVFSEEFMSKFKLILWDIPTYSGRTFKAETSATALNAYHISGFDGSIISFLMEGTELDTTPRSTEELMKKAFDQELLNKLVVK